MADPYYRLRARVRERSVEMVEYAVETVAQLLDNTVPVKTGNLKNSQTIRIGGPGSDERVNASITYNVPYFYSSDRGWEGKVFGPKTARKLYFYWENAPDNPQTRFHGPDYYEFDQVNHPGWPGTRWYSDVVTSDFWQAALQRATRDLS